MSTNRILGMIFTVALPILLIVGGIASGPIMESLKPKPEARSEAPKALAVFTGAATLEDVQLTVSVQGEVAPRNQANLAPQVPGRVTYVAPNLVNGGSLKKGQLLMRVEDADYKLALVRAESTVASARQRLLQTEAEADLARRELEDLGITDASPLALKQPQLEEARASLAAAEAQLMDAELQLQRTGVYAPFDGRVLSESVDIGQFVGAGAVIAQVFATDVMEVELQITDQQMGELGLPLAFNATDAIPGPEVRLEASVSGRKRQWDGKITRTGAAVNSRTRLISVYAEVQDPFGAGSDDGVPLAPGLFVDADIIGRAVQDIVVVPREALRGLTTVYAVETIDADAWREERKARGETMAADEENTPESNDGDKNEDDAETAGSDIQEEDLVTGPVDVLRVRAVEVLKTEETRALLLSGLAPGERVVLSPVQAAFDGMRLRIMKRGEDGVVGTEEEDVTTATADAGSTAEGLN